jgi:putative thioredoxin
MPNQAFVLEGTRENFSALVLENSRRGPVLVDFWAPWAGPSLRQKELLQRLAQDYGGRFLLVSLNTDREKEVAHGYGVKGLPSCKLFRNGRVVEEVHGMQTEADYRALIDRHLRPLADRAQAAALAAWEAGEEGKAIQVLAEAAMAEPDNPAIPLMLAKLLMRQGRHGEARDVLAALPPALRTDGEVHRLHTHLELIAAARDGGRAADAGAGGGRAAQDGGPKEDAGPESTTPESRLAAALARDPEDHAARFALGARCVVADDYAAALEHFAELERRAPDYRGGLAHEALLLVLDLLGPDDERVRRYRRTLFGH